MSVAQPSFKVMTINTHKGFTALNRKFILPELRDAVRSVQADVVFLQEVHGTHEGHAERHTLWPDMPQYEFMADEMWPEFAYGRNAVYPEGDHGNAVMSKFPIRRFENHDVSVPALNGPEKRGLLHCVLELPETDQEVHVICVHLGLREVHRNKQLDMLCKLVAREVPDDAPLIVAGDFNDWRLRAHRRLLDCVGLRDVFVDAYGHTPKTFPARWPVLRLDRIYVRGVSVAEPEVLSTRPWSHLSDHTPLSVEVRL